MSKSVRTSQGGSLLFCSSAIMKSESNVCIFTICYHITRGQSINDSRLDFFSL